jgi:DNA-binding NarL/FixJ family response regulator
MDLLPVHEEVSRFIRAGANAFIVKDATIDDFARTIRSVSGRADIVPPSPTGARRSQIGDLATSRQGSRVAPAARMTKREREITGLIAQGMSNKEIARALNIAVYTVKSHVHNILQKLAVGTRLQIAAHAYRGDTADTEGRASN